MRTPAGVRLLLAAAAAASTLTACAASGLGKPCKEPSPLFVTLEASDRLNEANGRSLPTVVQLIQLKDGTALESVSLSAWKNAEQLFADKALLVTNITAIPGDIRKQWVQRHAEASLVAAVGLFQEAPGQTSFLSVSRLRDASELRCLDLKDLPASPGPRDEHLHFKVQGYQIELLYQHL